MTPFDIRITEQFEHSTLPMALLMLHGELLQVNRALCRLVGLNAEELIGLHTHELGGSEQDLAASHAALEAARSGVDGGEFTQTWFHADDSEGREIHVRIAWSLMHDPQGAPWYISVICIDESVRIGIERERAREGARFRARFEQSAVPQTICDLGGRLLDVNQAYCDVVGLSRAELRGRSISDLNHRTDEGGADRALQQLVSGEVTTYQAERMLRDAGGGPVPVLVNAALIRNEQGQPESAAAYYQDLSALRGIERRRQQQEDFFLALSQRSSDVAVVTSAEGELCYVSPSVTSILGYEAADMIGADGWAFLHPDDEPAMRETFANVLRDSGSRTVDVRLRTAAGDWRVMEETLTNLLDTAVGGVVCNLRDITDRRAAEDATRASENRLRTIVDTAEEGIWAVRFDGSTLYMNRRMAAILGVARAQMRQRSAEIWSRFAHEGLRERIALVGKPERFEVDYRHPDGRSRVLSFALSPLRDAAGAVEGSLVMIGDLTDARRLEDDLRHAAMHDSLTGLPNRALLLDRLEHALARSSGPTAVMFVDLDHFKVVNDSRGHAAGDELLIAVTARLKQALRPQDTVARFGGDEFVLVCEDVTAMEANELAEGVLATLEVPLELQGTPVHVTASLGMALSPAPSAGDLLRFADAAMYSAKAAGRRRVRTFDAVLARDVEQRYAMHGDLHAALADESTDGAMSLHYQPVVDLASGKLVGVEGLARWTHPVHGEVPPTQFVSLAEQTGLAAELDRWAVRRGLQDVRCLRAAGALPLDAYIALNLSAGHLAEAGLAQLIAAATAEAGLPPEQVVLEITEGTLMDDLKVTIPVLSQLRDEGFRVAVDDFGTGYSSLGYLRDLPITSLKIDRSFVSGIVDDQDALAIVASVVDLAKAIGLSIVAEGVETQAQADLLLGLGATCGQGWLWSRAVAPTEALAEGSLLGPFAPSRSSQARPSRQRKLPWGGRDVTAEHGLSRMLDLHHEGASLSTIAAALNREGFASPQGAKWHRAGVARTISWAAYPQLNGGA